MEKYLDFLYFKMSEEFKKTTKKIVIRSLISTFLSTIIAGIRY